uniref:Uncharacterized protein n=1 Tax=Avena sativa TaxID=4498 RepID=A0ACD5X2U3_AVESA
MPPLATAASSASPRCGPFACHRGAEQRAPALQQAQASASGQECGRPLGRAAGLVGGGIAAAFFASLERCACVEVRTTDDLPEAAAPLLQHDGAGAAGNRATGRKNRRAPGKGRKGGGFGCCENIN